jgi:hypothetical protein
MKKIFLVALGVMVLSFPIFADNKYNYCRDRAIDLSGYDGRMPQTYKNGQAFKGALKGAASGAALGWVVGGNSKSTKKAAKRAAGLGFLIGAIKQAKSDKKRKAQNRKRRNYQYELDGCMSSTYRY